MKKITIFAAAALVVSLGAGSAAYAWHGEDHNRSSWHGNGQHHGVAPAQQSGGQAPSFNQHGGGHEQAQNNQAIHESERNDPKHSDNPASK